MENEKTVESSDRPGDSRDGQDFPGFGGDLKRFERLVHKGFRKSSKTGLSCGPNA